MERTHSGECCEPAPSGFEGPEKILEVDFFRSPDYSMRALSQDRWDAILDLARCQILSKTSTHVFDAYVLSESSLFVYDHKVFIKTCGTTTLLRCLPLLLKEAKSLGLELDWLCYSRKNFIFPDEQVFPHSSFAQEIEYTKSCYGPHGEPLKGGAYILGDLQGDHWYVFTADYALAVENPPNSERNLNIMMYGLDPEVCKQFYRRKDLTLSADAQRVTDDTGIRDLCPPDTIIDDCMFEPCGYSMNGLLDGTFYTIHVTPEEAFSYASFETNYEASDYDDLVRKVLEVFRPERVALTLFGDDMALDTIKRCPTLLDRSDFVRETQSTMSFRDEYTCRLAVYGKPRTLFGRSPASENSSETSVADDTSDADY